MQRIVTLCRHEDGRPVAMASYSGEKADSELPVAQELLTQSGAFLENATITSDALHPPKKNNCLIFELGGDNLSAIKKNQGNYHKYAEKLPRGAKNLALIRNALLAVILFKEFGSLNDAFDYYRDHREKSVRLITTASPVQP